MGERLLQVLKLRNKREIGVGPLKGKNQLERLELSQTRGCIEGHSKRASSHRPQRESSGRCRSPSRRRYSKHKRQPADRRKCSAGGLGSVPTVREEQWRDPRTPEDTQPQRGPPGKNAPAAAGH